MQSHKIHCDYITGANIVNTNFLTISLKEKIDNPEYFMLLELGVQIIRGMNFSV